MKREEVKNKIPGITDEQLDWLMGENGRDVTAEKTKAANLQTQVNDLTTQLNTAKDGLKAVEGVDVADLKGQITKLRGQLSEQADCFAFDSGPGRCHPRCPRARCEGNPRDVGCSRAEGQQGPHQRHQGCGGGACQGKGMGL